MSLISTELVLTINGEDFIVGSDVDRTEFEAEIIGQIHIEGDISQWVPYLENLNTTCAINVGRIIQEVTAISPHTHLAPNHQDYTPNHCKPGRDKFKRSGRR